MKQFFICIGLLLLIPRVLSQVAIGDPFPSEKATLEVKSQVNETGAYLGLMPPRIPSEIARNNIIVGAVDKGLTVYVESTGCLDIFNGSFWEHIKCASSIPVRTDFWINEIHYNNFGVDTGEFVELVGVAGLDITGYSLVLYNGATGAPYDTIFFTLGIPNVTGNGYGFVTINYAGGGIQNGNPLPDAIALVNPAGKILQFLSYGGVVTGISGPAEGVTSIDIGIEQTGDSILDPAGGSLQLTGSGSEYADFNWIRTPLNTSGIINFEQILN